MNDAPTAAKPVRDSNRHATAPTDQAMPCYVIGLTDTPERWQPTIAAFAKLGIQAQLWPAVDGRHGRPPLRPGERLASRPSCWILGLGLLKNPEVGCVLSHYRLLQHCYHAGHPRVAVFEDDIVPLARLPKILTAIAGLDDSYGLIHLAPGGAKEYIQDLCSRFGRDHQPQRETRLWPAFERGYYGVSGTFALVFQRLTIAKLLDRLMPVYMAYDHQLLHNSGIHPWLLAPPTTRFRNAGSIIGDHSPQSRQYRRKFRFFLLKWVRLLMWHLLTHRYPKARIGKPGFRDHLHNLHHILTGHQRHRPKQADCPTVLN